MSRLDSDETWARLAARCLRRLRRGVDLRYSLGLALREVAGAEAARAQVGVEYQRARRRLLELARLCSEGESPTAYRGQRLPLDRSAVAELRRELEPATWAELRQLRVGLRGERWLRAALEDEEVTR